MEKFIIITFASLIGIYATIALFYECLYITSTYIILKRFQPRTTVFIMITSSFIAHAVAIVFYAMIYWTLIHFFNFSGIEGNIEDHFPTYLYFSSTTYSSLGIGDVFPIESLRILAGIEAINGLILITWSAAFSYSVIQKMRIEHMPIRIRRKKTPKKKELF